MQPGSALVEDAPVEHVGELGEDRPDLDWVLPIAAAHGTAADERNAQHSDRQVGLGRHAHDDGMMVLLGAAGLVEAQHAARRIRRAQLNDALRGEAGLRSELGQLFGRARKHVGFDGGFECREHVGASPEARVLEWLAQGQRRHDGRSGIEHELGSAFLLQSSTLAPDNR